MDLTDRYRAACETPSDINEHLPVLHDLALRIGAQTVIELGVRTGNSTAAWLAALQTTGGRLWSVDIDPPPAWFEDELVGSDLSFLRGDDLSEAVRCRLPASADIVFIDTIHTYEQTAAELAAYHRKVRTGGWIVLHDTAVEAFGHHVGALGGQPPFPVRRAVEEFQARHGYSVVWRSNNHGLAMVHLR